MNTHRRLDGQIREVDEPFEMGGMQAMYPGDFGDPAEDCNCRCIIHCLNRNISFLGPVQTTTLVVVMVVSDLLDCTYARLVSQIREGGIDMHNRGSLGDFHAFKSASGGSHNNGSSSGGSGCSTWFYGANFGLLALNELCKLF